MKRVLHVGSGGRGLGAPLPLTIQGLEVTLDIDPAVKPDIVASMTDLGQIGEFETVYCCHALEHLHYKDVGIALGEFRRVLEPGGRAVIRVPDLEDVRPTEEVVYESLAGPVTGLDMLFGMRRLTEHNPYMMHKFGFVQSTLEKMLGEAGFSKVVVTRVKPMVELLGVGIK